MSPLHEKKFEIYYFLNQKYCCLILASFRSLAEKMLKIDKDTDIYCSFSTNPGNNGCEFFNKQFQIHNLNAIYKSFRSESIKESIDAVKALDIRGFALVCLLKYMY